MWARCLISLVIVSATGCSRLLSIQDPVADDGGAHDGSVTDAIGDGTSIDAPVTVGSPILLSEVVLAPADGEMIEIVNTSSLPVDLSTYYLSDNGNYFRLPVAVPA